jgi:hypothetical protein
VRGLEPLSADCSRGGGAHLAGSGGRHSWPDRAHSNVGWSCIGLAIGGGGGMRLHWIGRRGSVSKDQNVDFRLSITVTIHQAK